MATQYNITPVVVVSTLLRAYGIRTRVPEINDNNPYDSKVPAGDQPDPALYLSPIGTPVVADITFVGGTYTDDQTGQTVTFGDYRLALVLMTVTQPKKIVKTDIQGRDGTIKEYIGKGDYQITINGIINGPNGVYPAGEVSRLKDVLDAPITIPVISRYLQLLGIYNIVVEDYTFDQEPGGYSYQKFTANCISDKPVELIIIK